MLFYLGLAVSAPLRAFGAFVLTLPYLVPAILATLLLPTIQLSPGAEARLGEITEWLDWLPRRRLRTYGSEDTSLDPWIFVIGAVICFTWIMVVFRSQRAALRVQGHGDTGSHALLIVPSLGWLKVIWVPFLLAAIIVAVQVIVLERDGQWAWLTQPVDTASPLVYAKLYWPQMQSYLLVLFVIFVPVGVMQAQRAAQERLPFSTLGMGGSRLILLGGVFLALSIPIAMGLVGAMAAVLHTAEGPTTPAPLYVYLSVQGCFLWFALSCASVAILDRRLNIIADRLEGMR